MAKKKQPAKGKIQNRRASYDYELGDSLVAGLVLNGRETKSLRLHHGHLKGSFITIKSGEAWLMNATITSGPGYNIPLEEQTKARKLLLKKREVTALQQAKDQGKSIIPLELLTSGQFIKLKLAAGKGKKRYDKRETIKKRDIERETRRKITV